eukprot:7131130-Pyramimonas_sp.AAC.1
MPRPQHAQSGEATHHGAQTKHGTTIAHCARDKETTLHAADVEILLRPIRAAGTGEGRGGSALTCKWGGATA